MASSNKLHFIVAPVLVVLLLYVPSARAQGEVDHQDEFSYVEGAEDGPEKWGKIKKDWVKCGNGTMQSPINITKGNVEFDPKFGKLENNYQLQKAFLVNRGHDIELRYEGNAGHLWISGNMYLLKQMHWHSPSEHAINGRRFDMELHMVHVRANGNIAVVGVLYQMGANDTLLKLLEPAIERLTKKAGKEEKIGEVDAKVAVIATKSFYRYRGSLTTPPCTEGVRWTIMREVQTVSEKQLTLLREAVNDGAKNNARPLQKVNDRRVLDVSPPKS